MTAPLHSDLALVKSGFLLQGTTFKAWCRLQGLSPSYAHEVVAGKTNGPKARALRAQIVAAARKAA